MNREQIYSAVWARLEALPGFKTKSRRLQHWTDTPATSQPALFMAQTGEATATTTNQPAKWRLQVKLYLYAKAPTNQAPSMTLNPLLDAVCNAIHAAHPVTGRPELGIDGLEWCRVEGAIETDEGTLGDQAVAIIPITILVAD